MLEFESYDLGISAMIQLAGLSRLKPNMVLLGYKADWMGADKNDLQIYFKTIRCACHLEILL